MVDELKDIKDKLKVHDDKLVELERRIDLGDELRERNARGVKRIRKNARD